jgi:hypothetical protein
LPPYDDVPHNFSEGWDEATPSFSPYKKNIAADADNDCVASKSDEEVESAFQSESFFVEAAQGLSPWWMEDEVVGTHNKGEEGEKKEEPQQHEDEQMLHQNRLEEAARIERELCVFAVMLQEAEAAALALKEKEHQLQLKSDQSRSVIHLLGAVVGATAFVIMDMPSLMDQDHSSDEKEVGEDADENKEEYNTDGFAEEIRKAQAEIELMRLDDPECRSSAKKGVGPLNTAASNASEAAEEARLVACVSTGEEARQLEEHLAQLNIASVASPSHEEKEEAATRAPIVDQEKEVEATSAATAAAEEQEQEQQREEVEEYNMKRQGSFRVFSESLKLRDAEQARMAEGFRRAIASQKRELLLAKWEELKREAEQKEQWRLRLAREAQEALQRHVAACMTAEEARLVSNVVCAHNEVMSMAEVASRPRVAMSFFEHYESQKFNLEQNEGMNMAQAARKLYGTQEPELKPEINDPCNNTGVINKIRVANNKGSGNRQRKTVTIKEPRRKNLEQPKKKVKVEAIEEESGDGEERQGGESGSGRQYSTTRSVNANVNVNTTKAHAPSSPTSTLNPQQKIEFDIKYENTFLDKLTAVLAGAPAPASVKKTMYY